MLKPIKFANAVALVAVILQLGYALKVAVVPDWAHYWVGAMMPGYNFTYIETNSVNWGMALVGTLITAVLAWIATFVVVWIYNRWDK